MGFISSIFSGDKGAGFQGQGADIQTAYNPDQLQHLNQQAQGLNDTQINFLKAIQAQNGVQNQGDVFAQQQALANQLQGVANGTGPNPALAQLNQTTGNNIANQAALMAGQRGASANAGLLARNAALQGGNLQQQAAGQGAILQAQQQLAAMNALSGQQQALGNTAQAQIGNQQNAANSALAGIQQQQGNQLGALSNENNARVQNQSNINNVNAQIAQGNQKSQQGFVSGLGNAVGGAIGIPGLAHGGAVPNMGPQSFVGQHFHKMSNGAKVPGKAEVAGDSKKNDKVPTMLSPGEIVIPRSVVNSENPSEEAAKFVAAILNKSSLKGKK